MNKGNILIIDDDKDIIVSAEVLLENEGYTCYGIDHPDKSLKFISKKNINVILLDMNYIKGFTDGKEGKIWLSKFKNEFPEVSVIPITAYTDVELAVNSVKQGAFDFILKPWDNHKFLSTVSAAIELNKTKLANKKLYSIQKQLSNAALDDSLKLIGESDAILKVKENINKVAKTDANVLIIGESGTGKEIAAKLIHKNSTRKDKIFYRIDAASIQSELFESELFGYEKGAFTDAKETKIGKIEIAHEGTLFIDEISALDIKQQAKLLSVLQNRKITRLGSTTEIDVDIRLICSTNKSLTDLINQQKFREDLFFRINTFEIYMPALKERPDDIELIANYFLKLFAEKYHKHQLKLNSKSLNKLKKHNWPGNVRELNNVIERAVILSDRETLNFSQVFVNSELYNQSKEISLNLAEMEKKWILMAIEKHKGNMSKAAKELGLKRSSFYRRLDKYGIK